MSTGSRSQNKRPERVRKKSPVKTTARVLTVASGPHHIQKHKAVRSLRFGRGNKVTQFVFSAHAWRSVLPKTKEVAKKWAQQGRLLLSKYSKSLGKRTH